MSETSELQPIENPLEEKKQLKKDSPPGEKISLSKYTTALLNGLRDIRKKTSPGDQNRLTVSRTVSFLAFVYEKVRNALEYREEQLILRAAIERILKRRLALNPQAKGEAENLLRELVWARYFASGNLGDHDVDNVQKIIDRYLSLRYSLTTGRDAKTKTLINDYFLDLLTCEIEEYLNPEDAEREAIYMFYIYQILRQKIAIDGVSEQQRDSFLLVALDKAYRRSDTPYQRYHLFVTFYKPIYQYNEHELSTLAPKLPHIFNKIDEIIRDPSVDRLTRYVRKQLPPFLVLFEILNKEKDKAVQIIDAKDSLWAIVDQTCRDKYTQSQSRLRNLAVKSLIYIFITKMVLALILEYPVSIWLYGRVDWLSISINTFFPPILMVVIVALVHLPGEDNTKKIYNRIIDIISQDQTFETMVAYKTGKIKNRKPLLVFGFSIFYTFTYFITLYLIHLVLQRLKFFPVSELLFVFFVSVVSFFSYRIKQVANEYRMEEREGIFSPILDVFFMPILSIGKFLSSEIGKLNFFILIFDFIIEAPFKLVFEVVEEWIAFVRQRKEEIV